MEKSRCHYLPGIQASTFVSVIALEHYLITKTFQDPTVYPHFDIYPSSGLVTRQKPASKPLAGVYPHLIIYPPVSSGGDANRARKGNKLDGMVRNDSCKYYVCEHKVQPLISLIDPIIRPYPPVYPHFDLYPEVKVRAAVTRTPRHPVLLLGSTAYPSFSLCMYAHQ